MIYFSTIFTRAGSLFDDPDIRKMAKEDRAGFEREMLKYLINAIHKPSFPSAIGGELLKIDPSISTQIEIDGDGSNSYVLEGDPLPEKAAITFYIDKEIVQGTYDRDTNTVTLSKNVETNHVCFIDSFYAGAFLTEFKNVFRSDFKPELIQEYVLNILVYATLSTWGDEEANRALELRNILTDTDFKLYSPANSAVRKMEWRDKMNHNFDSLASKLSWYIMSTPIGGSRFGK